MILAFNCYLMRPHSLHVVSKPCEKGEGALCVVVASRTHLSSELCDMTCTVLVILIVIYRRPFKWRCCSVQTI